MIVTKILTSDVAQVLQRNLNEHLEKYDAWKALPEIGMQGECKLQYFATSTGNAVLFSVFITFNIARGDLDSFYNAGLN